MKNTHNASGHHIVKRDRCRKGKPAINKLMRGPLAAFLSEMAVESYGDAVLSAAREKSFPSEMPWALADTLRDDFILD
ncbi:hypothetical protein LN973_003247 [Salmonella enterica]|nr:hypothetical protein [Salmonella enterica]EIR5349796.1 hypothetical protein [Salmonella enterica]EIS5548566.1 hypothetical protein [Salmonella enterica]EJP2420727.1 hypothetical protein [Salmonella enterica]